MEHARWCLLSSGTVVLLLFFWFYFAIWKCCHLNGCDDSPQQSIKWHKRDNFHRKTYQLYMDRVFFFSGCPKIFCNLLRIFVFIAAANRDSGDKNKTENIVKHRLRFISMQFGSRQTNHLEETKKKMCILMSVDKRSFCKSNGTIFFFLSFVSFEWNNRRKKQSHFEMKLSLFLFSIVNLFVRLCSHDWLWFFFFGDLLFVVYEWMLNISILSIRTKCKYAPPCIHKIENSIRTWNVKDTNHYRSAHEFKLNRFHDVKIASRSYQILQKRIYHLYSYPIYCMSFSISYAFPHFVCGCCSFHSLLSISNERIDSKCF